MCSGGTELTKPVSRHVVRVVERGRSVSKRGSFLARKSRAVICSVKGMV